MDNIHDTPLADEPILEQANSLEVQPQAADVLVTEVEPTVLPEESSEPAPPDEAISEPELTPPVRAASGKRENPTPRKKRPPQISYQPEAIIQRLRSKPGILKNYVDEAHEILWLIHNQGAGAAIALLLSEAEQKRKRRVYHDLVKWVFREKRLRGKNNRSLIESIVYGKPAQLQAYTAALIAYLEAIIVLSQNAEKSGVPHE